MKNKTLYVSDLDGTLLRSDQTLSDHTVKTLNRLISEGVIFSYATARSYATSSIVAAGLDAKFPVIVYNGTFILEKKRVLFMFISCLRQKKTNQRNAGLFISCHQRQETNQRNAA